MNDATEITALALWVVIIVAYLRRLFGTFGGHKVLPAVWGPLLAIAVGQVLAVGGWVLGLRHGDWRAAVVLGLQASLTAMGGYSGLKALVEEYGDGDRPPA